jgi:hypothetical protein
VNPGLTIIAQALRVADHIREKHLGLAAAGRAGHPQEMTI